MIAMTVILTFLLIVSSILLSAMVAGYETLSTSHLRHWARQKDLAAKKLYPLKARGSGTLLTIEFLRAISLSAALVLITTTLTPWFAWIFITILLFAAFIILTELYLKPIGIRLLILCSGPILTLTNFMKPIMLPLGRMFDRFLEEEPVTLTRQELQRMLASVSPEDTDLTADELRILGKVLTFAEHTVHSIMIPKSRVVSIKVTESLTPIVLDELHKTGHAHFPVMAEDNKTVVGMLHMHDLMDIKLHSGVAATMQPKVYFVDEDRDLDHVLQVFYKTKQTVFVVLNATSDMVGLITIEDVIQCIVGQPELKPHTEPKSPKQPAAENLGTEQIAVIK
jgi:CBS domain containing-hemolysin-like protein